MNPLKRAVSRLRNLWNPERVAREIDEELRFHVEMEARDLMRRGVPRDEAWQRATRDLGRPERIKDEARAARGFRWLEDFAVDARQALRQMRLSPGFTLVSVATMALGIGVNTAVYSVVDGVLVRPLPYPEPAELVTLREVSEDGRTLWPSYQNFADWRDQSESFEAMAAMTFPGSVTVLGGREPAQAAGVLVTNGFFDMMGVPAELGRTLVASDHAADAAPVAVVSHDFWVRVLGSVAALDGVRIDVDGEISDVVGVMPPGFKVWRDADMWGALEPTGRFGVRGAHWLQVVGRLRDASATASARAQLDQIARRIRDEYGADTEAVSVRLTSLHEEVVGEAEGPLGLLLGASGLLLLVACTNIASTLLARGARRRTELSLRASLGASRGRVVRQLYAESVVLAGFGALAGTAIAFVTVGVVARRAAAALPRLGGVGVDLSALAFAFAATLLATLLFGLLPALRIARRTSSLGIAARSGGAGGGATVWRALVGAEVALVIVLLLATGLLVRSLFNILGAEVGYDDGGVLVAEMHLTTSKYPDEPAMVRYFVRLSETAQALPGVDSAGIGSWLPLAVGSYSAPVILEDGTTTGPDNGYRVASRGYFETLRIPLLRGRLFEPSDTMSSAPVAVVNQTFADRYWPGEDVLGKRFRVAGMDLHPEEWLTVVGVVGEARHWRMAAGTQAEYYVSYQQRPFIAARLLAVLVLRGAPAADLVAALREQMRAIDADVPVTFTTLASEVSASVGDRRFTMRLLAFFAAAGLLLAAVGIFGVLSHSVAARRAEIGVRLALGATPSAVLAMIIGSSMRTVSAGALAGLLGGLGLDRLISGMLFDVAPADPLVIVASVLALVSTALLASWGPARRATRADPVEVMRR